VQVDRRPVAVGREAELREDLGHGGSGFSLRLRQPIGPAAAGGQRAVTRPTVGQGLGERIDHLLAYLPEIEGAGAVADARTAAAAGRHGRLQDEVGLLELVQVEADGRHVDVKLAGEIGRRQRLSRGAHEVEDPRAAGHGQQDVLVGSLGLTHK